jgi:hypothetical protein
MRIVFEIKRDAIANVVLNKLYKFTALQTSFSVNNICLVGGRPRMMALRDLIQEFVEFRHEVVIRRTKFDLRKAEERAHVLEGLIIASDNIDEVIEIIKTSPSPDTVVVLIGKCEINGDAAKIIVDEVLTLEQAEKKFSKGYVICIRPDRVTDEHLRELKDRCNTRDADDSISFVVMHPEGRRQYLTTMKIKTSKETTAFLCSTFGESNVLIDTER